MTKLLLLLILGGALANGVVQSHQEPPLLIDTHPAPASLDASS